MKTQKRIDGSGRIHIPKDMRRSIGVREDDLLNVTRDGKRIILEKGISDHANDDMGVYKCEQKKLNQREIYGLVARLLALLKAETD